MSIKDREYTFSVDKYKNPNVVTDINAKALRLMELIMMEPGDDPLHPDMGVGIKSYRYSFTEIDVLEKRIADQIRTYLPFYQNIEVTGTMNKDKTINVTIKLDGVAYVYDSATSSKPITLSDIQS